MMHGACYVLLFLGAAVFFNCAVEAKVRMEGLRLVGGKSATEGRIEVRAGASGWGSVCDDSFTDKAAYVVCAMLGYENPNAITAAKPRAHFGQGTGPIHLDDVRCEGDEESLNICPHRKFGTHNCRHSEDVGVICGATEWSKWHDYDNPSGGADHELSADIPGGACGGTSPILVQVQVRIGTRWLPLLTTDVLIHVGPAYGLVCVDYDNRWRGGWGHPYCRDFHVRYSLKKGGNSPWINTDNPVSAGDYEWHYVKAHKKYFDAASGVEFRTSPRSRVTSHRPIDRFIHAGAKFGFKCYNEENTDMGLGWCRDYRTRYLCYKRK